MERADAEEYTEALGQVVTGGWRQVALGERLGVPAALGLTTRAWVEQRLGGYVRLAMEERREAVGELVLGEGMSQRRAADVLGVTKSTVNRDVGATVPDGTGETDGQGQGLESGAAAVPDGTPEPEPQLDVFADEALARVESEDDRLAARERDARLLSLVSKAIAAAGPLTTALPAVESMLARLDRDRLESLGPRVESTAQTLTAVAQRTRELQHHRPRLVKGGTR